MSFHKSKILKLFELNEESSQILEECAKYGITTTNTGSVDLKLIEETHKGLKLEMALIEVDTELEKVDHEINAELKEMESLKKILAEHKPKKPDLKTPKMIEKLESATKEVKTPDGVNLIEITNKVKKLQK